MREPAISGSSMPMFHICRYVNDCTWKYLLSRFAFFLIPSSAADSDQHLTTSARSMVYMPVVTAARFECDIKELYLVSGYRSKIALSCKIFCICSVGFSDWKEYGTAIFFQPWRVTAGYNFFNSIILPYSFCKIKCRPGFRPSGVKSQMGQNLGDFRACNPVLSGGL